MLVEGKNLSYSTTQLLRCRLKCSAHTHKKLPCRLYSVTTGKCESSNKNTTNLSKKLPTGLLMSLKKESSLSLIYLVPLKTAMFYVFCLCSANENWAAFNSPP